MNEQGSRFSPIPRGQLTDEQLCLFEKIVGGSRASGPQAFPLTSAAGDLNGPFSLMLLQPRVGSALQELGSAIRYSGGLSPREREIAILSVAEATGCKFEKWAHERVGLAVGLTAAEIAEIATGAFDASDMRERTCHDLPKLLLAGRTVDGETYSWAVGSLCEGDLYELSVLTGYYATLAWTMGVFDVGIPREEGE